MWAAQTPALVFDPFSFCFPWVLTRQVQCCAHCIIETRPSLHHVRTTSAHHRQPPLRPPRTRPKGARPTKQSAFAQPPAHFPSSSPRSSRCLFPSTCQSPRYHRGKLVGGPSQKETASGDHHRRDSRLGTICPRRSLLQPSLPPAARFLNTTPSYRHTRATSQYKLPNPIQDADGTT